MNVRRIKSYFQEFITIFVNIKDSIANFCKIIIFVNYYLKRYFYIKYNTKL
jgi:hypothetical protein